MADNLAAVLDEIQEDRPQPEVPGLPFLPGGGHCFCIGANEQARRPFPSWGRALPHLP